MNHARDPKSTTPRDAIRSWRTFDDVARHIDRHDVFEYWRSTPYPLNLMERNSYQVRTKFEAAAEQRDPRLVELLKDARGLLDWDEIEQYQKVDPGNTKLRGLSTDVLDRGAWKLLWLPPCLPYYEASGPYADPELQSFTKRLIFSAWSVVPKAIAVMLSYEAERRAMEAAGHASRNYDARPVSPPLQFRMHGDRPAGMPALALLYPSYSLAQLGDPLEIARTLGAALPLSRQRLFDAVRERITQELANLPEGSPQTGTTDQRWYWAAPLLLDRRAVGNDDASFNFRLQDWGGRDDQDQESRLAAHLRAADEVHTLNLGPRPSDLADVLTDMAIAGPGVCALRALSRVTGGPSSRKDNNIRYGAYQIAHGLRSLFNKRR